MKQQKVTFAHNNAVSLIIICELNTWSKNLSTKFTLGGCMFGAVKLTKNTQLEKYGYNDYGIDLIHVHNFLYQAVTWVKTLLVLV